jgi:protein-L-isoaspartate(D-aspartate) O-methyltransferase
LKTRVSLQYSSLFLTVIYALLGLVFMLTIAACATPAQRETDMKDKFKNERLQMVERQIKRRGISDERVLAAMEKVPRHLFVPVDEISSAYDDSPLPIGHGQTISQPYIVALMTEALDLKPHHKVLEIGTGSGYQAAVLAELADTVFTIELVEPLGRAAKEKLKELGYDNVVAKIGDGYRGWPEHEPFDAIIVTAAPEEIPQALVDQIADGGRMIVPVGRYYQELIFIEKADGKVKKKTVAQVRFVPMVKEKKE